MADRLVSSRRRIAVIAAVLFVMCAAVLAIKTVRVSDQYGDSALFFQVTRNIAQTGAPRGSIYKHMYFSHQAKFARWAPQAFARAPLSRESADDNVLHLHTYFVLFPLALFARLAPVQGVLLAAFVLAFAGTIFLVMVYFERHRVPVAAAVLFAIMVMTHPAWGDALLHGQFYPDRIFVFAGTALMFLAAAPMVRRVPLVLSALLCVCVNERGALVGGLALILYVLLYWKRASDRTFKLVLGTIMLLFGLVMLKFVITSDMYGIFANRSLETLRGALGNPSFIAESAVLLAVNAVLFSFALFEPGAALIALATILPNLLGNMGGDEKIGWTSHYHSFYFPMLIWAGTRGFVRLQALASKRHMERIGYISAALALLYTATIQPYTMPVGFSIDRIATGFFPQLAASFSALGPTRAQMRQTRTTLAQDIPPGASVSAPETAMPFLWREHDLYRFPGGLDDADYALLDIASTPGTPVRYLPFGRYWYGPEKAKRASAILFTRMRCDGYDFDHPQVVANLNLAIVRRRRATHCAALLVRRTAPTKKPSSS